MSGPLGFGADAKSYSASLPADISVIAADAANPEEIAFAVATAAELRRTGTMFYTAPLLDDPRALVARVLAASILAQVSSLDDRRGLFEQLAANQLTVNNQPQASMPVYEARVLESLRDLMQIGDALLCRSFRQRQLLAQLFGRTRPYLAIAPGREHLPAFLHQSDGETIVVWAPHLPASATALLAFALEELRFPAFVVCADGVSLPTRACFVTPDRGYELLGRARLVVDAKLSDPGTAIAMVEHGIPVVTASTTGADEYLEGVALFDPWDCRAVFGAVVASIAAQPPKLRRSEALGSSLRTTLRAAEPPRLEREPLATVVMPTRNRPQGLLMALESLALQKYGNLEVLVINDGGEPIDDVVSRFPFARLIDRGRVGIVEVNNIGITEARGEYVGFLADDDIYYPDQIPRLVYAMETTKADVAHGNNIIRFVEKVEEGTYRPIGFKVVWDKPVDPTEMLWASTVAGHSFLYRRSALQRIGGVKEGIDAQLDYEFSLRYSLAGNNIHVDVITNEWLYRNDTEQFNVGHFDNFARDLAIVYGMYPLENRPYVQSRREAHMLSLTGHRSGQAFYEPSIRLTPIYQARLPLVVLRKAGSPPAGL